MDDALASNRSPWLHARDHVAGDPLAPIVLVEYGDYECAASGLAHEVISALRRSLRERLCYAFRHFPLIGVHPHALVAAEAAEAAGAQGRFWRMHDLLFENQEALDVDTLLSLAALARVDAAEFVDDLSTHRFADRVRDDLRSGLALGVARTPAFFVEGERYEGSWDFDSLWRAMRPLGDQRFGASDTSRR